MTKHWPDTLYVVIKHTGYDQTHRAVPVLMTADKEHAFHFVQQDMVDDSGRNYYRLWAMEEHLNKAAHTIYHYFDELDCSEVYKLMDNIHKQKEMNYQSADFRYSITEYTLNHKKEVAKIEEVPVIEYCKL